MVDLHLGMLPCLQEKWYSSSAERSCEPQSWTVLIRKDHVCLHNTSCRSQAAPD